jgi:hypothetical protein
MSLSLISRILSLKEEKKPAPPPVTAPATTISASAIPPEEAKRISSQMSLVTITPSEVQDLFEYIDEQHMYQISDSIWISLINRGRHQAPVLICFDTSMRRTFNIYFDASLYHLYSYGICSVDNKCHLIVYLNNNRFMVIAKNKMVAIFEANVNASPPFPPNINLRKVADCNIFTSIEEHRLFLEAKFDETQPTAQLSPDGKYVAIHYKSYNKAVFCIIDLKDYSYFIINFPTSTCFTINKNNHLIVFRMEKDFTQLCSDITINLTNKTYQHEEYPYDDHQFPSFPVLQAWCLEQDHFIVAVQTLLDEKNMTHCRVRSAKITNKPTRKFQLEDNTYHSTSMPYNTLRMGVFNDNEDFYFIFNNADNDSINIVNCRGDVHSFRINRGVAKILISQKCDPRMAVIISKSRDLVYKFQSCFIPHYLRAATIKQNLLTVLTRDTTNIVMSYLLPEGLLPIAYADAIAEIQTLHGTRQHFPDPEDWIDRISRIITIADLKQILSDFQSYINAIVPLYPDQMLPSCDIFQKYITLFSNLCERPALATHSFSRLNHYMQALAKDPQFSPTYHRYLNLLVNRMIKIPEFQAKIEQSMPEGKLTSILNRLDKIKHHLEEIKPTGIGTLFTYPEPIHQAFIEEIDKAIKILEDKENKPGFLEAEYIVSMLANACPEPAAQAKLDNLLNKIRAQIAPVAAYRT